MFPLFNDNVFEAYVNPDCAIAPVVVPSDVKTLDNPGVCTALNPVPLDPDEPDLPAEPLEPLEPLDPFAPDEPAEPLVPAEPLPPVEPEKF
jgi:hypothetical protein